jgi:lipooligosaccharide transport system permease protein
MAYAVIVIFVLIGFSLGGWLEVQWFGVIATPPLLFIAGIAFATLGLLFTAIVPTIDHMNIPFYLVIMPLGFASNTYFPLESDSLLSQAWLMINPLRHLAEGVRLMMLSGVWSYHLWMALLLFGVMILILLPIDLCLLRRRVLGER